MLSVDLQQLPATNVFLTITIQFLVQALHIQPAMEVLVVVMEHCINIRTGPFANFVIK